MKNDLSYFPNYTWVEPNVPSVIFAHKKHVLLKSEFKKLNKSKHRKLNIWVKHQRHMKNLDKRVKNKSNLINNDLILNENWPKLHL